MKKEVGLWIDHFKAVTVSIVDGKAETREIRSNVDKYMRLTGGWFTTKPNMSRMSKSEDMVDRRYKNHLNGYYDEIISMLRDADAIWIFGPGEAKVEFQKRLEHEALGDRIVSVETVDKMTDRQIAARVRQQVQKPTRISN